MSGIGSPPPPQRRSRDPNEGPSSGGERSPKRVRFAADLVRPPSPPRHGHQATPSLRFRPPPPQPPGAVATSHPTQPPPPSSASSSHHPSPPPVPGASSSSAPVPPRRRSRSQPQNAGKERQRLEQQLKERVASLNFSTNQVTESKAEKLGNPNAKGPEKARLTRNVNQAQHDVKDKTKEISELKAKIALLPPPGSSANLPGLPGSSSR
jgi:hypothetical protein